MFNDTENTQEGVFSEEEEYSKPKRPPHMISSAKKRGKKRNIQGECLRKIMRCNQWRFKSPD